MDVTVFSSYYRIYTVLYCLLYYRFKCVRIIHLVACDFAGEHIFYLFNSVHRVKRTNYRYFPGAETAECRN